MGDVELSYSCAESIFLAQLRCGKLAGWLGAVHLIRRAADRSLETVDNRVASMRQVCLVWRAGTGGHNPRLTLNFVRNLGFLKWRRDDPPRNGEGDHEVVEGPVGR